MLKSKLNVILGLMVALIAGNSPAQQVTKWQYLPLHLSNDGETLEVAVFGFHAKDPAKTKAPELFVDFATPKPRTYSISTSNPLALQTLSIGAQGAMVDALLSNSFDFIRQDFRLFHARSVDGGRIRYFVRQLSRTAVYRDGLEILRQDQNLTVDPSGRWAAASGLVSLDPNSPKLFDLRTGASSNPWSRISPGQNEVLWIQPVVTTDGTTLAILNRSPLQSDSVVLMPPVGQPKVIPLDVKTYEAKLSPDGKYLAYINQIPAGNSRALFLMDLQTGLSRQVGQLGASASRFFSSENLELNEAYSTDSVQIPFYFSPNSKFLFAESFSVVNGQPDEKTFQTPTDFALEPRLQPISLPLRLPHFSPNGEWMVASNGAFGGLVLFHPATGLVRRLAGPVPSFSIQRTSLRPHFVPGSLTRIRCRWTTCFGTGIEFPAPLPDEAFGASFVLEETPLRIKKRFADYFEVQTPWELRDLATSIGSAAPVRLRAALSDAFVFQPQSIGVETFDMLGPAGVDILYADAPIDPGVGPLAAIEHDDWRGLVTSADPARAGEVIHVHMTALGATLRDPNTGQLPERGQLVPTQTRLSCGWSFNGETPTQEPVLFSGISPNYVGVYQVEVKVPQTITSTRPILSCFSSTGHFARVAVPVAINP
jgi:uncharacterized protein (TIGR03437 family)